MSAPIDITAAEALSERAIRDTDQQRCLHPERRPTWAPPLPFNCKMEAALERLKSLIPEADFDCSYGRLWAVWAHPKWCKGKFDGFDLRAGREHNGEIITRIRPGRELWWIGPNWRTPCPPKDPETWEKRESRLRKLWARVGDPDFLLKAIARAKESFAEEQAEYIRKKAQGEKVVGRIELRHNIRELGVAAILAFAGAPDATMQSGARLAGICCRCGRILTDASSRELGIGPECFSIVHNRPTNWSHE